MKPSDLRKSLDELALEPAELARITDVDARTVRRWLAGDSPVPRLLEIEIEEWLADHARLTRVRRRAKDLDARDKADAKQREASQ